MQFLWQPILESAPLTSKWWTTTAKFVTDKIQQQSHANKVQKSRRHQTEKMAWKRVFEISGGTSQILRNLELNIRKWKLHNFSERFPTQCFCTASYQILPSPSNPSLSPESINSLLSSDASHCAHYASSLLIRHSAPVLRLSQTHSAQFLLNATVWGKAAAPVEAQWWLPWLPVLPSKFVPLLTVSAHWNRCNFFVLSAQLSMKKPPWPCLRQYTLNKLVLTSA